MSTHVPQMHFDAVLVPHRSLSGRDRRVVLAGLGVLLCVPGMTFLALGLWPVTGFCVGEFLLLVFLFRRNMQHARAHERVSLTPTTLIVERRDFRGSTRVEQFEPTWLRVECDDPVQHHSQVELSSHGRTAVVGAFLSPDERLAFARALRRALSDWRARRVATP